MQIPKDIEVKVRNFCSYYGHNDEAIIEECLKRIENYLSYNGSSLEFLNECFESPNSWLFLWNSIQRETDRISGEREKQELERKRLLLDYEPVDLGNRVLTEEELKETSAEFGVIDGNGVFHSGKRGRATIDHRTLANYLASLGKIAEYYIRIGCAFQNDGILCAESLYYGNNNSLKNFLLNEKMAIALYNAIMSKNERRFHTFEERLAYYGDEFGFQSLKFPRINQIYDRELFNRNMRVLSDSLGQRFDLRYFKGILDKELSHNVLQTEEDYR